MAYRLRSGVELLIVKDQQGRLQYHYAAPGVNDGPTTHGQLIPWIGDEQRHLIDLGLVEDIADAPETIAPERVVISPPAVQPAPETDDDDALDEDAVPETVPTPAWWPSVSRSWTACTSR
jgi:hypothetical protein